MLNFTEHLAATKTGRAAVPSILRCFKHEASRLLALSMCLAARVFMVAAAAHAIVGSGRLLNMLASQLGAS